MLRTGVVLGHAGRMAGRGIQAAIGLGAFLLVAAGAVPTFTGTRARPQDDQTLERGLLRNDLQALRTFRSREATWLLAADSALDWERHVSRDLVVALASPPAEFATFARSLDEAIGSVGPDIAGGVVRVALGQPVKVSHR